MSGTPQPARPTRGLARWTALVANAHPAAWIMLLATGLFALWPFKYNPIVLFKSWTGTFLLFAAGEFALAGVLLVLFSAMRAVRTRDQTSWRVRFFGHLAKSPLGQPGAAVDAAWFLLSLSLVLCTHFFVKITIHAVNPRLFDDVLTVYDRSLCFGTDPTYLLASLLEGKPWALHAIDFSYTALYGLAFFVFVPILLLLLPERANRLAFGIAYLLIWIIGAVMYIAFPSWGPVFTNHEAFAPALAHMPNTDGIQRELARELYALLSDPYGPRPTRFGGVAAFPSLHIAVLTVLTWSSRPFGRWVYGICLALLATLLLGSMVTGYHYLFDGLAGMLLGAASCLLSRRWADAYISRQQSRGSISGEGA